MAVERQEALDLDWECEPDPSTETKDIGPGRGNLVTYLWDVNGSQIEKAEAGALTSHAWDFANCERKRPQE